MKYIYVHPWNIFKYKHFYEHSYKQALYVQFQILNKYC